MSLSSIDISEGNSLHTQNDKQGRLRRRKKFKNIYYVDYQRRRRQQQQHTKQQQLQQQLFQYNNTNNNNNNNNIYTKSNQTSIDFAKCDKLKHIVTQWKFRRCMVALDLWITAMMLSIVYYCSGETRVDENAQEGISLAPFTVWTGFQCIMIAASLFNALGVIECFRMENSMLERFRDNWHHPHQQHNNNNDDNNTMLTFWYTESTLETPHHNESNDVEKNNNNNYMSLLSRLLLFCRISSFSAGFLYIYQSVMTSDQHRLQHHMCSSCVRVLLNYLRWKRVLLFLDEWFSYGVLFFLYYCTTIGISSAFVFYGVIGITSLYILYGYGHLWHTREQFNIHSWLMDNKTKIDPCRHTL